MRVSILFTTLQKVMAGDQVSTTVQYYFASGITNSNPNIIPNILSSLSQAIGGNATAGTLVHSNASAISTQLNGTPAFTSAVEPSNSTGSTPQAYLTILFFDERFNLIAAADGGVAQQQVASTWSASTAPLGLTNIKAPKSGYAYIYVSNRSDQAVYFDNLVVNINAGNIIEENHYYAFGLKIAGISSKKLGDANEGKLSNHYQYNDKEMLDEDAGLNWYDYGFRSYDPQIGRFMQLDPLTDSYTELTPFQFAGNDPIANVDLDGLEELNVVDGAKSAFKDGALIDDAFHNSLESVTLLPTAAQLAAKAAKTALPAALPPVSKTMQLISIATKIVATLNRLSIESPVGDGNHWQKYLLKVAVQGAADASWHANSLGFGGTDREDEYNTPDEKAAYLRGKLAGSLSVLGTAGSEIEGGLGGGAGLALETGGISLVVGGAFALHGSIAGVIATGDIAATLKAYYKLNMSSIEASGDRNPQNSPKYQSPNPEKTQWGWRGAKVWRDLVNKVRNGGTIEELGEKVPTKDEAVKLINDAGGRIDRIEGPHLTPNPHNYNHINYTTPSGGKGTIKIQNL